MHFPSNRVKITTVTVVDRQTDHRNQLCQVLTRCAGVVVFDQCATLHEAEACMSMRLPRVLLLGDDLLDSPGWHSLDVLRGLRGKVLTIALSDQRSAAHITSAFRKGAVGYLLRQNASTLVNRSVQDVTSGGSPMSPEISRVLVQSLAEPEPVSGQLASLSSREREVLELLSVGARYGEVATRLKLSRDTVHSHAKYIYR
jgi:hypothetical protein